MKVLLLTFNCSYIHQNLALRWLYVANQNKDEVLLREYTLKDDLSRVIKEILTIDPDLIGISVYIWNAELTKQLLRQLKKIKSYRILLGGPEVSYAAEEWLEEDVEAVLRGEGEITFWQAAYKQADIDGYYGKDYISPIPYAYVDLSYLETLESPYFLAFDQKDKAKHYLYLESSRGCPYHCTYCLSSLDNKVRYFSLPYLKKQLLKLKEQLPKQVKFLDRTFNAAPQRALAIAQFINELDLDCSFQFEVALEFFPESLLAFFEKSKPGRFRFEVGVQTFNAMTLKAIRRVQNSERLVKNIQRLVKAQLILHTDLIAGLPFEDYASFKASFAQLFALKTSEIQLGILKLLKGTAMMNERASLTYSPLPPYEVLSTDWLSKFEMDRIKAVAKIVDKLYNTGRLKATFDYLFAHGYDVFEIMAELKFRLDRRQNIQLSTYFLELFALIKAIPHAQELLLNDYYPLTNERPQALFARPTVQVRRALYQKLIATGYHEQQLNTYCLLDYALFAEQRVYQLVFYSPQHCLAKRELFTEDFKFIKCLPKRAR